MSLPDETMLKDQVTEAASMQTEADPNRPAQCALILAFLTIIASVPLIQMTVELAQGDAPKALDLFKVRPTAAHLRAYEKNLEAASVFASQFRPWLQFAQFEWLRDGGEKALIGREGWLFYKPGFDGMVGAPVSAALAFKNPDPLPGILAFRDDLAAHGIQLLIVVAPNKESVYPDMVTGRAAHLRGIESRAARDLLARLESAQVTTVDLFRVFAEARSKEPASAASPLYLVQDSHWSPSGVQLAAKWVADRLLELGWIKLGAVQYSGAPVVVRRTGDILRMLQVPRLERQTPPESVDCEQLFRTNSAQPYRNDLTATVLVMGDSFLRIYQQDEPGSAGFISHLAKELRQPVASLVSDGGASTLVRQELYRRPGLLQGKKVVIWQFVERDIQLGAEGWQIIPLRDRIAAAIRQRSPEQPGATR